MIKSIEIKKLFGRFDYKLDFNNENIIILTGPNGYGKSTILKMIHCIANDSIESIFNFDFDSFKIVCIHNYIKIMKRELKIVDKDSEVELNLPKELSAITEMYESRGKGMPLEVKKRRYGGWADKYDVLCDDKYGPLFDYYLRERNVNNEESKIHLEQLYKLKHIFDEVKNELGTVSFIKEQRLLETKTTEDEFGDQHVDTISVVQDNSKKLIEILKRVMEEYSKESTSLDSTYVKRLLDSEDEMDNYEDTEKRLQTIKETQGKLKEYGFLTGQFIIDGLTNEKYKEYRRALLIYIEDMIKKYSIFNNILNKLGLYKEIINNKLKFKKVDISYLNGIQIKDNGNNLKLTSLSSGEQEILVLYYKLIFESDVNVLLIDEPEISLHILWQQQFISDLLRIVGINKDIQIIIATHSPDIIADNGKIQIDLGGLYSG